MEEPGGCYGNERHSCIYPVLEASGRVPGGSVVSAEP